MVVRRCGTTFIFLGLIRAISSHRQAVAAVPARTGPDYQATPNLLLTLEYAFTRTYPDGKFAVAIAFPEHRIDQGQRRPAITFSTAFDETTVDPLPEQSARDWIYQDRFRYLPRGKVPLSIWRTTVRPQSALRRDRLCVGQREAGPRVPQPISWPAAEARIRDEQRAVCERDISLSVGGLFKH